MDLIEIREFDGDEVLSDDGRPLRERVVRIVAQRTGKIRRMERNALLSIQDGEAVVSLGNRESARAAASIVAWEGPGLDGLPITIESLDALAFDGFWERVFKEIEERLGEKAEPRGPKAPATPTPRIAPSSSASVLTIPARGPSNTSREHASLGGRLINWTE